MSRVWWGVARDLRTRRVVESLHSRNPLVASRRARVVWGVVMSLPLGTHAHASHTSCSPHEPWLKLTQPRGLLWPGWWGCNAGSAPTGAGSDRQSGIASGHEPRWRHLQRCRARTPRTVPFDTRSGTTHAAVPPDLRAGLYAGHLPRGKGRSPPEVPRTLAEPAISSDLSPHSFSQARRALQCGCRVYIAFCPLVNHGLMQSWLQLQQQYPNQLFFRPMNSHPKVSTAHIGA
jgi:hypothetical protein